MGFVFTDEVLEAFYYLLLLCAGIKTAVQASSLLSRRPFLTAPTSEGWTPTSVSGKGFLLQLFLCHPILFPFPDIYSFNNSGLEILLLNESNLIFCGMD